jgi:hypothetical protein
MNGREIIEKGVSVDLCLKEIEKNGLASGSQFESQSGFIGIQN